MTSDDVQLDDLTSGFLSESREMLDEVEPYLVELGMHSSEMGEVDEETVNLVFRLFHSLKGSAGFFQFSNIVEVTHIAETLLDLFRSGRAQMMPAHTDVLCRACDVVGVLLEQIERTGGDSGYEEQVERISAELAATISQAKGESQLAAPEVEAPEVEAPEVEPFEPVAEPDDLGDLDDVIPMSDLVERFTQEADEQLDRVEQLLLEWEKDPGNLEPMGDAFRNLHSFKGNSGILGYAEMERLSHSAETVLDAIREGKVKDPSVCQTLLFVVDTLRSAVGDVSQGGRGLIENLGVLLDMLGDVAPVTPREDDRPLRAEIKQPEALALLREEMDPVEASEPIEKAPEPRELEGERPTDTQASLKARSVIRNDIRVDLRKLDLLINLVGEMVIAESMVTSNPDLAGLDLENFEKSAAHLNKIVRDLQDVALSVRMIPISGIFRKMIRLVHDLSAKAGKKIELTLLGEETEIDKTVAEQLADPLVHLVRNAIDHGVEMPEDRVAQGKNETGQVTIEAKHEGGEVWIQISDDGRGLSRGKILAKGIERGLVKGDGSEMSDSEVYNLIFEPGFSTADKVTDISGRGVGMDVVKKNIEKIKGRADITSQPGRGTVFILRIPLTLAIMEGMLVRVGSARYTIPILSIRESMQVTPERVTVTMDGQEMVRVREDILPVLRLHELHKIESDYQELDKGLLIILESQGEAFCLFVDEILGEQQTVIKGLTGYMGEVRGVSGCTILGDGEISLILDVGGLISIAMDGGGMF